MYKYFSFRNFIILAVFILAFFLRFNKLTSLPPGLGRDEVSVAYNAYSILQTGRDEHGKFMPLYFKAIGDEKLPVIIYLDALSVKLFGLNAFGTRFPFAFLGSLTVVFSYLLLKEAKKREKVFDLPLLPILIALLLAINPWQIAHSRAVYEITLSTFFFTMGTYAFLKGLKSSNWFLFSVTVFIINFYTYSMTRLLSPLLFLYLVIIYKKHVFKFSKPFLVTTALWGTILLIPFFVNFFDPGGIYGPKGAVILTSSKVKSSIMEFRSYTLNSSAAILGPVFFNRVIMTTYEYGKNIMAAISPKFYFANGSDMAGIGTNGQFYLVEFIPFVVGLWFFIKLVQTGSDFAKVILGWIVLTFLTASLTVGPPYGTRTLFIVVPMMLLIACGWIKIFEYFRQKTFFYKPLVLVVILIYLWHFTFYLTSYYIRFPVVYAQNWEAKNEELFHFLKSKENDVGTIVITKPEYSMYAFHLFYDKAPPQTVWTGLERHLADPDGWEHGKKLGKYEFRDIDWKRDFVPGRDVIFVSRGNEYPDKLLLTKEILYPTKYTVFPYGQKIVAYPEKQVAFKIWYFKYNVKTEGFDLVKE